MLYLLKNVLKNYICLKKKEQEQPIKNYISK